MQNVCWSRCGKADALLATFAIAPAVSIAKRDYLAGGRSFQRLQEGFNSIIAEAIHDIVGFCLEVVRLIRPAAGEMVDCIEKFERVDGEGRRRLPKGEQPIEFATQCGFRSRALTNAPQR